MIRKIAFVLLVVPMTGFLFVLSCIGLALDPLYGRGAQAIGRTWARGLLALVGVRLVVEHGERWSREPCVVLANHSSYLDIPALMVAFPGQLRIVARRSLVWIPFIGWYVWVGGHFFIDRDDVRQAVRMFDRIARRMQKRRVSALVFPEGTRSVDGRLGPIRSGALFLPLAVGAPIQPVALFGTRDVLPKGSWLPARSGTVVVRVGVPVTTAGRGSVARKALAAEVEAALVGLGVPPRETTASAAAGDAPASA
jgi:1-acyl-sn-glycerol-3-phosphate acyltransferase